MARFEKKRNINKNHYIGDMINVIVINLVFIRLKGIVFFVKKSFITSDRCIELLNEKKNRKLYVIISLFLGLSI